MKPKVLIVDDEDFFEASVAGEFLLGGAVGFAEPIGAACRPDGLAAPEGSLPARPIDRIRPG